MVRLLSHLPYDRHIVFTSGTVGGGGSGGGGRRAHPVVKHSGLKNFCSNMAHLSLPKVDITVVRS